eukprot:4235433-Prymnesium_polylepis.1
MAAGGVTCVCVRQKRRGPEFNSLPHGGFGRLSISRSEANDGPHTDCIAADTDAIAIDGQLSV